MATQSVIGAVESALHAASILARPKRGKSRQKRPVFPTPFSESVAQQNRNRFAPAPWLPLNMKENQKIEGATYIGLQLLDSSEWVKQYSVDHRHQITKVAIVVELMDLATPPVKGIVFVVRPSGELLLLKCTSQGFVDFDDQSYEHEVEVLGRVCYMAECYR